VGRGSITDIVTGLQLLSHCYLQQAHSVIRPVQENCELLDLFAADPDAASRWMETETPGKEFSPRAVREQLGQNGPEETYGHLSEIGTHPRLAGMQSAGGILVSDEERREASCASVRSGRSTRGRSPPSSSVLIARPRFFTAKKERSSHRTSVDAPALWACTDGCRYEPP
jgi:hypothetical protein